MLGTINLPVSLEVTMKQIFSILLCMMLIGQAKADEKTQITIAVASNFHHSLLTLLESYPNKDVDIRLASGSTGALYAQIRKGAPYDLFLAADSKRPQLLEQQELTGRRHTYAIGKLAFWAPRQQKLNEEQPLVETIKSVKGRLALANPRLAPFGMASQQTLTQLGLWQLNTQQKILGQNISQVFQFVDSGNANAGFVAESLLKHAQKKFSDKKERYQSYLKIPSHLHEPITQQLVTLKRSKSPDKVSQLVDFLLSQQIQSHLSELGYITVNNQLD